MLHAIVDTAAVPETATDASLQLQEAQPEPPLVTALDIRVGKIIQIDEHPDADRSV